MSGETFRSLVNATRGQLESAARSIADHPKPKLAIITGFFVPATTPPAAETDGPIGAAILAAVLERSGIEVELVTDDKCRAMLEVARDTVAREVPVVSVSTVDEVDELREKYRSVTSGFSHVVSIERPGPAASGRVRNFKGHDLTDLTAPLHRLFEPVLQARGYVTIAVGDGGNEIGMGSIDPAIVAGNIQNGVRDCVCDAQRSSDRQRCFELGWLRSGGGASATSSLTFVVARVQS